MNFSQRSAEISFISFSIAIFFNLWLERQAKQSVVFVKRTLMMCINYLIRAFVALKLSKFSNAQFNTQPRQVNTSANLVIVSLRTSYARRKSIHQRTWRAEKRAQSLFRGVARNARR